MFICHVQQPSVVRDENGRSNMLLLVRAPVLTCHSTANKTCVACAPAILADVLTEEHYITKKKRKTSETNIPVLSLQSICLSVATVISCGGCIRF